MELNNKILNKLMVLDKLPDATGRISITGANSKVVLKKLDKICVALKIIKRNPNLNLLREIQFFFREVIDQILVEHPAVLPMIAYNIFRFSTSQKTFIYRPCLATKFCSGGTLREFLDKMSKNKELSSKEIQTQQYIFAYGIARGMKKLYLNKILHRDLKNDNIYVSTPNWTNGNIPNEIKNFMNNKDKYYIPFIADLGLAKMAEDNQQSQQCGTYYYLAPEVMASTKYSFPVDVYSYAVILSNIFQLKEIPEYKCSKKALLLIKYVTKGGRPEIPKCNEKQKNFLNDLWCYDPQSRLTFVEIVDYLEHPKKGDFIFDDYDEDIIKEYKNFIDLQIECSKPKDENNSSQKYERTDEEYYHVINDKELNSFISQNSNHFQSDEFNEEEIQEFNGEVKINDYISTFIANYCSSKVSKKNSFMGKFFLEEGILSEKKKDFRTACEFYTKSTKFGNLSAVTKLGLLMLRSPSIKTRKGGYELLQYSAAQKEREGLYYYGYLIKEGFEPQNIPANKEAAAEKFIESGEEGHPKGFYQAGQIYHEIGIKLKKEGQNDESRTSLMKAVEYYSKSYETYKDEESNRLSKELQNYLKKK